MIASRPFQVLTPTDHFASPNEIAVWSQSEYDILQTLAIRVRLISARQATRIWQSAVVSECAVQTCFDQLVVAGLLQRYTVNAHPLLEPDYPLATWKPGTSELEWRDVSNRARRRWTQPSVPLEVFAATKRTANLFGGNAYGLSRLEHRDHDLLLGDAYVAYRQYWPNDCARWIGEEFLPKAGYQIKDPDAFLIDDEGQPIRVVESAGRYSPRQVESFHDHCVSLQIPYELW